MPGEKVSDARKRLAAALERTKEIYGRVKEKAVEGAKAADEAVHEHPYQALGIAFGVGDTFWTKSPGYLLRQVAFSRSTWQGGAVQVFTSMPSAFGGIGVDPARNILGGVNFSDAPTDLQLYLLTGNANPPALFNQAFFGSQNLIPNSTR